jgi:serine/threonine protein kinase
MVGDARDARGDIYGLGATLYYLLTGRPPFVGDNPAELLNHVRDGEPTRLAALRPDLPPELIGLVGRMMDREPDRRPATAFDVEMALVPFCRPGTVPALPIPTVVTGAGPASGVAMAEVVPVAIPTEEPTEAWGVDPGAFAAVQETAAPSPRKRQTTAADKARTRLLLVLGGLLHLTGVGLLLAWALGAFNSSPPEEPTPPTHKKDEPPRTPKKQRSNTPG